MKAMLSTRLACYAALLSIAAFAANDLPPAAKTKIVYTRDIEPLLASRCYMCHGRPAADERPTPGPQRRRPPGYPAGRQRCQPHYPDGCRRRQEGDAARRSAPHRHGDRVVARLDRSRRRLAGFARNAFGRFGGAAHSLVLPQSDAARSAGRDRSGVAAQLHRRFHSRPLGKGRRRAFSRSPQDDAHPPRESGSHRSAAVAAGSGRVLARQPARCL